MKDKSEKQQLETRKD